MMTAAKPVKKQKGAVALTVTLLLLFLLGFMGLAIDVGHMFVVKTELQTAVDSCALAAAHELDEQETSIERARNAGVAAGNANPVNMQSANWSGEGQLTAESISFYDRDYVATTDPLLAAYAECAHVQPNIQMWLLHAMGAFIRDATAFPATRNVAARAAATRVSAQTTCPIPVALQRAEGTSPPLYGFQVGEWVTVYGSQLHGPGSFGWYNLDGSNNARSTRDQLESGQCNTRIDNPLGTPGAQVGVQNAWNYRFGIYKNNENPAEHRPDLSGYSYTSRNWVNPPPQNAFEGEPAPGSDLSAQNFLTKRSQYRSFDDQGTSIPNGSTMVFGSANALNSFQILATPGEGGQHHLLGGNRRLATVPVIDGNFHIIDFLCVFMLHPMTGPQEDVQVEIRGNAGSITSPCTTSGQPGGIAGPLVPALVR